MSFNHLGN